MFIMKCLFIFGGWFRYTSRAGNVMSSVDRSIWRRWLLSRGTIDIASTGGTRYDLLLLSTHSSLIIGGSPLLLSDGGSPPASPASLLAGLLRRRDPSTNPGPIAWWVSVGN